MLTCFSVHQRRSSIDALERLSVAADAAAARLREAHHDIRGAVVLATCNRFEAYFELADASPVPAMDAALESLAHTADVPYRDLRESVSFAHGDSVASHLFAVASGLDSVALGEDEISGQVGRALDAARRDGTVTASLDQLFRRATEASRAVKNTTALGESGRSLVRLSLDLITSRVGDWARARVLLVGTGRYAAVALASLRARGAVDVRVHSPSGRRRFARDEHLAVVDADAFAAEAAHADVVVTCTTVTDAPVLTAAGHALARAGGGPRQVIVDLGMPRNVDPGVRELAGVELLDLDTIRLHAPIDETVQLGAARQLIADAAHRHAATRRAREIAPAIVDLRTHVHSVLDGELDRLRRRGGDVTATESALRHFAGVLLHGLTVRGHELAATGSGAQWRDAVETLLPAPSVPPSAAGDAHPPGRGDAP